MGVALIGLTMEKSEVNAPKKRENSNMVSLVRKVSHSTHVQLLFGSKTMTSAGKKIVPFSQLRAKTAALLQQPGSRDEKLALVARFLHDSVAIFDWVGFYLVDPNAERELILGPYTGAHTDHTRIAFGQGICGQAAETLKTFVVQDVSKETNYLSCSSNVNSEIVLPLFKNGVFVGELDIDSHALAPFTDEHKTVLEGICEDLSLIL